MRREKRAIATEVNPHGADLRIPTEALNIVLIAPDAGIMVDQLHALRTHLMQALRDNNDLKSFVAKTKVVVSFTILPDGAEEIVIGTGKKIF